MLKLRLEQLTYRIREEADFIDWYVNDFMPDQLPEYHTLFDVDTLKEMTKNGRDRAIKHGFNQPISHSHFITLMWHIGADFYQQPGFKAIAESNEPEAERIDAFYQLSDDLWDEAGEQADERFWFREVTP